MYNIICGQAGAACFSFSILSLPGFKLSVIIQGKMDSSSTLNNKAAGCALVQLILAGFSRSFGNDLNY